MSDIFSAAGLRVHSPWGPRKSGIPESVEMPAPVRATTRRAPSTQARTRSVPCIGSGDLDLAAAAGAAQRGQRTLRHHDLRGSLAAHLLQLLHRALDRFLRELAELLGGFLERARTDLEADRQRARGREHLRLARVEHRARRVAHAVFHHRGEPADRADAPVGKDFLEVERLRVDLDVARRLFSGSHARILPLRLQDRSLKRWILPVAVFGSSLMNSIHRGYL